MHSIVLEDAGRPAGRSYLVCKFPNSLNREKKMILKYFVLAVLIKILLMSELPFLCSGLYTAIVFGISMMGGRPFGPTAISCLIVFVLTSIYFWLLDRYNESGLIWWVILILGGLLTGMI